MYEFCLLVHVCNMYVNICVHGSVCVVVCSICVCMCSMCMHSCVHACIECIHVVHMGLVLLEAGFGPLEL